MQSHAAVSPPLTPGGLDASAILETISDAFFALDRELRFTWLNARAAQLCAVEREALVGRAVEEAFPSVAGSSLIAQLRRVVASGVTESLEYQGADGSWVHARCHPSPDGLVVILQDVSVRRRQEERLRRSERRCRAVVEATSDIVWWLAADGAALQPSPAWERFTGMPFERYRELGWSEAIHPDDQERALVLCAQALDLQLPVQGEFRLRRADGVYRRCVVRALPVRDEPGGPVVEWVGVCSEVEEARRAHEAQERLTAQLEQERRWLDGVLDQLPCGVVIAGAGGELQRANRYAVRMLDHRAGETPEATVSRITARGPDGRLVPPGQWPLERALQQGATVAPQRVQLSWESGRRITLNMTATALRDAKGRVQGAVAIAQDVTAQSEAEERLRQSEERWRLLAEELPHFVWTCDERARLHDCNEQFRRFLGLSPEGLQGHRWGAFVHPEDLARAGDAWRQAQGADGVFELELRLRGAGDPQAPWRWFVTRARRLSSAGGQTRWFGTCTDIDARKRAEERLAASEGRLRLIARSNLLGVCRWSADGRLLDANEALVRLLGLDPAAAQLPSWRGLLPRGWWQAHKEALLPILSEGVARPIELELQRPGGGRVPVLLLVVSDAERKGEGLALCVDLSERQRAEQLQAQLLDVVGHDLRSPLGALIVSAQMLLAGEATAVQRRGLERILRSAMRMHRLVRDLVDATQLRVGRTISVAAAPCDVERLCQQAIGEVGVCEPGRQFELSGEGDPGVEWDAERIEQALANLLTNAVRHGASDAPIRVRWSAAGDRVRLEVRNAGLPVDPQLAPLLFEPFRRGPASGPHAVRGSMGLGLFIVRQIARAHGGEVGLTSSAEEGTVAWLELPRVLRRGVRPAPGAL